MKTSSAVRILIVLLSFFAIAGCHESALPTSPDPPVNTTKYSIVGQILSAPDRIPMAGVRIEAAGGGAVPASTASDADGMFRLTGLSAGFYEISASRDGFVPAHRVVKVGGSSSEMHEDFLLEKIPLLTAYEVGGFVWVKGAVGRSAYVDATVEVLDGPQAGMKAMSDEMGMYLLRPLSPGTVTIRASRGERSETLTVVFEGPNPIIDLDFEL